MLALADEERAHQEKIKRVHQPDSGERVFAHRPRADLPKLKDLLHDVAQDQAKPFLAHAAEHELATAAFYEALSETAKLPGLKRSLKALAEEEKQHASTLQSLQDPPSV